MLRHTLATRLLERGSPLKEIADVLRHRALDTSLVYTKLDTKRLTAVALPLAGERVMNAQTAMLGWAQRYLEERRHLGFDLRISGAQLLQFARYVDRRGHRGPLTLELMRDWAQGQTTRATSITWARRLDIVRPFAKYLVQFEPHTEVPDTTMFGPSHRRLTPHIYTDQEIRDLITAAGRLPPAGGLRPATYQTLLGLIAAAGLRLSEALHLHDSDVNVDLRVLTVRQTKFNKSRQLPLHPSSAEALSRYRSARNRYVSIGNGAPFFVSTNGSALPSRTVHCVFARLRQQLGWTARGGHPHPRIHDLRHAFAVRRVMQWHERGTDIDHAMLALATYLGHAKVSDTYWYLTGVPELMAIAANKFERFAQRLEVSHE